MNPEVEAGQQIADATEPRRWWTGLPGWLLCFFGTIGLLFVPFDLRGCLELSERSSEGGTIVDGVAEEQFDWSRPESVVERVRSRQANSILLPWMVTGAGGAILSAAMIAGGIGLMRKTAWGYSLSRWTCRIALPWECFVGWVGWRAMSIDAPRIAATLGSRVPDAKMPPPEQLLPIVRSTSLLLVSLWTVMAILFFTMILFSIGRPSIGSSK
jgi:hypothetical protein